jgi:hypothetical protein
MSTLQSFIDIVNQPLEQPLIASLPWLRITKDPKYADMKSLSPNKVLVWLLKVSTENLN